jgi:hypothetical protein
LTEKDRLVDVIGQLGISGDLSEWSPEGLDLRSVEGIIARAAGMPMETFRVASASVTVSAVKHYFDREGRYLGLVGGDEQPAWEGRQ